MNISANLINVDDMNLGINAGWYGLVNQTAGTVDVATLNVGDGGTAPSNSVYNLSNGSLSASGITTIKGNGIFRQTGGDVTVATEIAQNAKGMDLESGSLVEISGGTWLDTSRLYSAADSIFRIIGDDADVTIHQISTGTQGTFEFLLDETGVSTLKNNSWGDLRNCTFTIDGSAYAGGPKSIVLYSGSANQPLGADYTVTGLGVEGVDWKWTETLSNPITITLQILGTQLETWAYGYDLTGTNAVASANPDGDPLNNLYEFGLGGNPTNSADIGTKPVIENGAGYVDYVHVNRVAASNEISYALAITSNLQYGPWTTNTGYTIVGYGPVVDDFDTVTNRISTTEKDQQFIKLIIEEL
jgi:hypothetical protein